jgi:hypothetical protein
MFVVTVMGRFSRTTGAGGDGHTAVEVSRGGTARTLSLDLGWAEAPSTGSCSISERLADLGLLIME